MSGQVDRGSIHAELELARGTFQMLVATASPDDLRRPTVGTRWTNQQLLFHLLLGYLVVLRLLWLVRFFGRLPERYSLRFAQALNAGSRPFHVVNYLGACAGAMVFRGPRLAPASRRRNR
jgi:DinB superfamily